MGIENIKDEQGLEKPLIREEVKMKIKNSISAIIDKFPIAGRNIIFLTDSSSVPFGWILKEYFKFKKENHDLNEETMPKFLRIDVMFAKKEVDFLKKYFSTEDETLRNNFFRNYIDYKKIIYGSSEFNENKEEKKLKEIINFSNDLLEEIENKLKKTAVSLKSGEKFSITIFDETLPNEVMEYKDDIYDIRNIEKDWIKLKTVPAAKFFIFKACEKLGIDFKLYAAGLNIWDSTWNKGFYSLLEKDFSERGKLNFTMPISPVARYEDLPGGGIYFNPSQKARIVPLGHHEIPQKLVKEMKEIGREIYLNKKQMA